MSKALKNPSTPATSVEAELDEAQVLKKLTLGTGGTDMGKVARVVYITKEVSHHLPISMYFATCPQKSLQLFSVNLISVTVSGMMLHDSPKGYALANAETQCRGGGGASGLLNKICSKPTFLVFDSTNEFQLTF